MDGDGFVGGFCYEGDAVGKGLPIHINRQTRLIFSNFSPLNLIITSIT